MKRFFSLCLIMCVVSSLGCAGVNAWWTDFKNNPVAQVTTFEQSAQVIISDAQAAFNSIVPFLPTDVQAKAAADFNAAIVTVNHALSVLNDAVQVAVDAQQPSPDFSKAIAAVIDAVHQVIAVVDQYKAVPAAAGAPKLTRPAEPVGLAEAKTGADTLNRWKK